MGPGLDHGRNSGKGNDPSGHCKKKGLYCMCFSTKICSCCKSNIDDARDSVLEFFGPLKSTSYGVFDSGYKYTYDRFNNEFIYLPLNADIAGMMVRTELKRLSLVLTRWCSKRWSQQHC